MTRPMMGFGLHTRKRPIDGSSNLPRATTRSRTGFGEKWSLTTGMAKANYPHQFSIAILLNRVSSTCTFVGRPVRLDDWYRHVNSIYLDRNFYRGPESIFVHLV